MNLHWRRESTEVDYAVLRHPGFPRKTLKVIERSPSRAVLESDSMRPLPSYFDLQLEDEGIVLSCEVVSRKALKLIVRVTSQRSMHAQVP